MRRAQPNVDQTRFTAKPDYCTNVLDRFTAQNSRQRAQSDTIIMLIEGGDSLREEIMNFLISFIRGTSYLQSETSQPPS